jgi:hypothetical protein
MQAYMRKYLISNNPDQAVNRQLANSNKQLAINNQ